jgi:hypothetical protein
VGRRYLRLGGSSLRLSGLERELFVRELVQAAGEITPAELGVHFEGGWRERKTASWLVVVADRTELRSRTGQLLLASGGMYSARIVGDGSVVEIGAMPGQAWCEIRRSAGRSWTSSVPSPARALNCSPEWKPGADPPDLTAGRRLLRPPR